MRIIDYFMVQIVLLLNHSEVLTVNENILNQLLAQKDAVVERPKNFL